MVMYPIAYDERRPMGSTSNKLHTQLHNANKLHKLRKANKLHTQLQTANKLHTQLHKTTK